MAYAGSQTTKAQVCLRYGVCKAFARRPKPHQEANSNLLPDEKSQVQILSEVHEHEQKSRKDGGSWSAVLACSRLFPARGAAKGPQRWAKGTARRRQSKRRIGRVPFAIRALIERTVPSRGGPCHRLAHNTHKGSRALGASAFNRTRTRAILRVQAPETGMKSASRWAHNRRGWARSHVLRVLRRRWHRARHMPEDLTDAAGGQQGDR